MSWIRIPLDPVFKWAILVAALGEVVLIAVQMLRGDALVCSDGSIFSKSCSVEHFPQHAVVAFNQEEEGCPPGWAAYDEAEGRFILGSGRRDGDFKVGATGGKRSVKLEIDHLPSHQHEIPSRGRDSRGQVNGLQATDGGEYGGRHARLTAVEGKGMAHENMPPYIALRWCKKE